MSPLRSSDNDSKHDIAEHEHGGAVLQQMVTLTAAQYESMYLTPKDASPPNNVTSTFGNPLGIGTIALVLIVLPWSLGQCNIADTNSVSYITLAPAFFFCGFCMLMLAGIFSWVQGLTFPCYSFLTYGSFSGLLWYLNAPIAQLLETQGELLTKGQASGAAAFGKAAASAQFQHALMFTLLPFVLVSCMFCVAATRTNVVLVFQFLGLIFFFAFNCANFYHGGNGKVETALRMQKIAGGWGIFTCICASYLSVHLTFGSVNLPIPVPVFDLSTWGTQAKQNDSEV